METADRGVTPGILDRHFGPVRSWNAMLPPRQRRAMYLHISQKAEDWEEFVALMKDEAIAFRAFARARERSLAASSVF